MTSKPNKKVSAKYLRAAQTRLILRVKGERGRSVDSEGNRRFRLTSHISKVELGWDEVIREGYDPYHSPLGRPVYYRVVNRGDEQLYCSTFLAERDEIIKMWGIEALAYCDPVTGTAVARVETLLPVTARAVRRGHFRFDERG
jgi:hypothetical protein